MGATGVIFDIKQLSVFDGPGIRTTVFLKGCPLRCMWCHNPEGLSFKPQLMVSRNGCTGCGKCEAVCEHPDGCTLCGRCVNICPVGLRRICGTETSAWVLADKLLRDADYLRNSGGGYTLSGGEPLAQGEFTVELLDALDGSHRAIETSGYCSASVFDRVLERVELVMLDLKLIDSALHKRYTGVDNSGILRNLDALKASGVPFIIRVPVIPGVNDSDDNFRRTAEAVSGAPNLIGVELLAYHQTAGAKYGMVGMEYRPDFDEARKPILNSGIFNEHGINCKIV